MREHVHQRKMDISCEELARLYLDAGCSAAKVARCMNCSTSTIYNHLVRCHIKTRSLSEASVLNRGVSISSDELRRLYVDEGLSIYAISTRYKCSPTTVYKKLVKCKVTIRPVGGSIHPYAKCDFNGGPICKAYLIGLRLGDLHVEQGKRAIRIRCTSTRPEQIELVRKLFAEYGGIWISKPMGIRGTAITALLNLSFSFLVRHEDDIEPWILADDRSFAAFWSGYIDAEGSFIVCNKRALLKVDSCDVNILHQTWMKLGEMGIELPAPRLVRPSGTKVGRLYSKRDLWRLATESRDLLLRLCELVSPYLQHDKRRADMEHVLAILMQRHVPKIGQEGKNG